MKISCKFLCGAACLTALLSLGIQPVSAQEFDVEVTLDDSQVTSASLNYLDNFPSEIEAYFNEYDWIDASFQEFERIHAELQIVLLSVDDNYNFQANLVVRAQRPIFNTMQQTTVFLFNDDSWGFNYTPNRALVHDELQFDAITTLLDFYAYVMLGFDFDSFSELGGTPYYSEAQNILALAQTTSSPGCRAAVDLGAAVRNSSPTCRIRPIRVTGKHCTPITGSDSTNLPATPSRPASMCWKRWR